MPMKNLLSQDITSFSRSALVTPEGRAQAERLFREGKDPVAPLVAQGLVRQQNFFSGLATVYNLPFRALLPVFVSPNYTVSLRIPASRCIKYQLYFFEEDGVFFCASFTPFIPKASFEEMLSFTPYTTARIVIVPLPEIRRALALTYHHDISVTATDRIEVVYPESSSKLFRNFFLPNVFPIGFFALFIIWAVYDMQSAFLAVFIALNIIYFFLNPYKIYVFFRSLNPTKLIEISAEEISALSDEELPIYTILLPVKNEAVIVDQLLKNILEIDYPREKLDIKFVCEVTDTSTIEALEKAGVGQSSVHANPLSVITELVKVPVAALSTKPRSCNYAAQFARGEYLVIYDAEDKPDRDQLKKAIMAFRKSPLDTVCAQAKLNFYNSTYNTLTRFFSLEYSFWYDFFLPGNQEMNSAITLGGTSNHFATAYLKKIGFWDPYNVTEDADLGLRIFRYHLHTTVFNSYTLEEANSELTNWLHQRTRWEKGFLMTLLVNIRHPIMAIREIGLWRYWQSLFSVASNFFLPFFNPVLWILFAATFIPFPTSLNIAVPTLLVRYIGFFNLIVGNATYLLVNTIVVIKKKQLYLLPYVLLLPGYWMLLSVACFRAAWQFVRAPYSWEKTRHGLTK